MMEKRDLKADLEQIQNFRSKWRQSTSLEEDWKIGVVLEDFCRDKAELWLEQGVVELERAEQLESLVRELAEALQLYENWEAKVIMDDSLWQFAPGLSSITQIAWYELVAIHTELNKVLHKAKEVLGDE
jgi:hypothetical protein